MKAFKKFSQAPSNQKPNGIPEDWPWQIQDCTEDQQTECENNGFTVLTDEDYTDYISNLQSSYDSWLSALKNVPRVVTPRQFRLALIYSGINLTQIESMLDSLSEPTRSVAKVTWEFSIEFQRSNPVLISLAPALGFSPSQLDDLFILAATL